MRGLTLCLANIWRVAGRCASRPQHQRRVCAPCIHARCGNQDLAQAPAQRPQSIHHDDGFVCRFDECGQGCEILSGREQDRPQTVPSEKHEAAVERPKPLWLFGLGGGRWRTRTSDLVHVKQIQPWTAGDYTGHSSEIVDLRGPSRTRWPLRISKRTRGATQRTARP
jgi:hypothetical protein